jgi:serine/threonine protein kinase
VVKRSFAGYMCEESLSVGLFGETFRGRNSKGAEARVVVVESRLSQRKNFAVALARSAGDVAELMHPHIVTTEKVGRGKDGSLVIIASSVEAPNEVPSLLARAHGRLARDVALSIAMGALRGLSHAHEHRIVHGGLHPRSVIVDGKGVSKLADFGLALALASAASKSGDTELLAGLRGFVAPELALGQEPDQATDVYGGGALVASLVWGQSEPPEGNDSALAAMVRQATSTDRMRRFSNAIELESAVRTAIFKDKMEVANAARVQSYISGLRRQSEAMLDADTEDLLDSLDLGSSTARAPSGLDAALAGLDDELLGLEDSNAGLPPPAPPPPVVISVDPLAGFADEEELTAVDDDYSSVPDAADALEEMIRSTPHPAVAASMMNTTPPRRSTQQPVADDYETPDDTPLPVPRPFHQDHTHAVDLVELVGRQAATSSPFHDDASMPVEPRRSNSLRWLALIAFVLATLFAVAYTKTDLLRGATRDNEARAIEALEEIERMQPKAGQITLLSETEEAAVWLLVGRTPATSFPLPSSMVHELRIEHEGFAPLFLSVGASHWSGEGKERKATLSASLLPQGETPTALPAFPPLANPPIAPGGPGQGSIKVESVPVGAEVWLLVGTTPTMTLVGIEAGRDYEFKVLKEDHRPAFAAFKAESWYLSGSEGPMRPILSERVVLEPIENPETGPRKKRKKR